MVGDSIENDIQGAEQVGVKAVLIDRGDIHIVGTTVPKSARFPRVIELL